MLFTKEKRGVRAELEDFYVHPHDPDFDSLFRERQKNKIFRHHQYISKNKEKIKSQLESWFLKRSIKIIIIYAQDQSLSPISRKGYITFLYTPIFQEPPTAWMIVHNLSHAIFQPTNFKMDGNPYAFNFEDESYYQEYFENILDKYQIKNYKNDSIDPLGNSTYPTTHSFEKGKITNREEAFHEVFTQWVVYGKVTFQPDNPRNRDKAKKLGIIFRKKVNEMQEKSVVLYNE